MMKKLPQVSVLPSVLFLFVATATYATPDKTIYNELPRFFPSVVNMIDLRTADLTSVDLHGREFDLFHLMFSTETEWPDWLPPAFEPDRLIELAKSRGPGIEEVHRAGYTGSGVVVALVEGGAVRSSHVEFGGRIISQRRLGGAMQSDNIEFHSTLMAGITIGVNVGIAPQAKLRVHARNQYVRTGSSNPVWSSKELIETIDQILLHNDDASAADRVRAVYSAGLDNPEYEDYEKLQMTMRMAEAKGAPFIDVCIFTRDPKYLYYGLEREPYSDPDSFDSYTPVVWEDWLVKMRKSPAIQQLYTDIFLSSDLPVLLFPVDPIAFTGYLGDDSYIYKFIGGWSQFPAYIAGIYSLALQMQSELSFDEFWDILVRTGVRRFFQANGRVVDGRIVDPVAMMEEIIGR